MAQRLSPYRRAKAAVRSVAAHDTEWQTVGPADAFASEPGFNGPGTSLGRPCPSFWN